jgi:hypothetical protein
MNNCEQDLASGDQVFADKDSFLSDHKLEIKYGCNRRCMTRWQEDLNEGQINQPGK